MSLHRHAMTSILMRDCPCPTLPALDLLHLSTCQTKIRNIFVGKHGTKPNNPKKLPRQILVVPIDKTIHLPPRQFFTAQNRFAVAVVNYFRVQSAKSSKFLENGFRIPPLHLGLARQIYTTYSAKRQFSIGGVLLAYRLRYVEDSLNRGGLASFFANPCSFDGVAKRIAYAQMLERHWDSGKGRDLLTIFIKNRPPKFEGFGPSILAQQTRGYSRRHAIPSDRLEARAMLHDHCPLTPGIYGWLDNRQQICYVGKSKSLRKRLLSYFAKTPADKKAERIRQHSETLVWEPMSDELLALIREQELINRWRPEFNTQGQPTKRQPAFICFSSGPAPNAFFTRRMSEKASHIFGPIAGTGRLRASVESINQAFQLRDCPDKTKFEFNNQPTLFDNPLTAKCIRYELGSCPGPCAGFCSRSDYQENVKRAINFVKGTDSSILKQLAERMQQAATGQKFERAAILRDHLDNLSWLERRLKALRHAQKTFNGVLPVSARKNRTAWLVLKGGRLVGSAPEPDSQDRAIAAIKRLSEIAAIKQPPPESILEMNFQLIMISWFRKHPAIKKTLVPFEDAIAICEDRLAAKTRKIA